LEQKVETSFLTYSKALSVQTIRMEVETDFFNLIKKKAQ